MPGGLVVLWPPGELRAVMWTERQVVRRTQRTGSMDDVQDETADTSEPEMAIYTRNMSAEDAEIFNAASAKPELGDEVRLVRTMMVKLAASIAENHAALARGLTVLVRLLGLQGQQQTEASDLEREILDAAADALEMQRLFGMDEAAPK